MTSYTHNGCRVYNITEEAYEEDSDGSLNLNVEGVLPLLTYDWSSADLDVLTEILHMTNKRRSDGREFILFNCEEMEEYTIGEREVVK